MLTSASTKQRCQEFSDFLRSSASGFELDLSGCSLIECIEQMIRVKNRLSEGYGKPFLMSSFQPELQGTAPGTYG